MFLLVVSTDNQDEFDSALANSHPHDVVTGILGNALQLAVACVG